MTNAHRIDSSGESRVTDHGVPEFVCPRCHGKLGCGPAAYDCPSCTTTYPIVLGIPDFRLFPDPWIGLADDRAKATRLAELVGGASFPEAVRAYWEMTPTTPAPQAARFTDAVLNAEERSSEWLSWIERSEPAAAAGPWLDLGCGTGDLVAAGAARGLVVIGVDIAMRWLVVAARRDALAGRTAQLVCANSEHLPFAPGAFARVVSLGMVEHCRNEGAVFAEAHRVLRTGAMLRLRTVNRYSALGEPHVGVWGVGLVPRRWADRFVRWRSGQRYLHHRPLSSRELRRGLRHAGFSGVRVCAAGMLESENGRLTAALRRAVPIYERLRRRSLSGALLQWVAPLLDARGVVRSKDRRVRDGHDP